MVVVASSFSLLRFSSPSSFTVPLLNGLVGIAINASTDNGNWDGNRNIY